jgi:signal transduction histidine kinase
MPLFTTGRALGVGLAVVLVLMAILFAGVVYLAELDAQRTEAEVQREIDAQNALRREQLRAWYDEVRIEHARQLAAPFLLDLATLEGVDEGTPEFERLQRRMWLFVYGKEQRPHVAEPPVGPLESVVVVDRNYRIVAASDPMVVDKRYTDPEEIATLDAALVSPQVDVASPAEREDGQPVHELTIGVPGAKEDIIGFVKLRYVGGGITGEPLLPRVHVASERSYLGPVLAGLLSILGVGFGAVATSQVIGLTRRLGAIAAGERLPPGTRGIAGHALSMIEDKLETLSSAVRRDDLAIGSIAEALREGVVLLDSRRQRLASNRFAEDLLGLSSDAADSDTVAPDDDGSSFEEILAANPQLEALLDAAIERGEAVRETVMVLHRPGGEPCEAQVTTYVLEDGEKTAGIMLVLKDQASIEMLERSLREASRLQTIATLTGSVAHEVKNPLGAVSIHLEHLRRRVAKDGAGGDTVLEKVGVISEEVSRLEEILDEWLRLTSPEERETERAAEVSDVLASVARLLRVEARHDGVELIVDVEDELPPASITPSRLRQVLLNLSINALQAMSGGGQLTLRATRGEDGSGETLRLEVVDTGGGIPHELGDQIYETHFSTRAGGSGLGLPICRRIVEHAGGALTHRSEPGEGTTFFVTLPARESQARPADADAETASASA